ncbi:MAG: UPF0175 family protein [Candidatus Accumulibacter similis]|nr:MAG: UPF0175 family protein [Candidatus Accumulibacter similis]
MSMMIGTVWSTIHSFLLKRKASHGADAAGGGKPATPRHSSSGVRAALATALFRDGNLSLGRAARLAEMSLPAFPQHLSRLGIPAIGGSAEEANRDMETLAAGLGPSSPTPAR